MLFVYENFYGQLRPLTHLIFRFTVLIVQNAFNRFISKYILQRSKNLSNCYQVVQRIESGGRLKRRLPITLEERHDVGARDRRAQTPKIILNSKK
jgi:hypothetical protein